MLSFDSRVSRVIVRGRSRDLLAFRRDLEQGLGSLDWHPQGLPETAILCVRTLADPLAGGWRHGRPTPVWRATFQDALAQAAKDASHPARETVGANVNAVRFSNQAELLACLARDWLRKDPTMNWWWRSLFPGRSLTEAVDSAWSNSPQHVPEAVYLLRETGFVTAFLSALPKATLTGIAVHAARAFGLEDLQEAAVRAAEKSQARAGARETRRARPNEAASPPKELEGARDDDEWAPWFPWVHVEAGLPAAAQSLLVLGVMLRDAPGVIRSLSFLARVRCFCGDETTNGGTAEALDPSAGATGASPVSHARSGRESWRPVPPEWPAPGESTSHQTGHAIGAEILGTTSGRDAEQSRFESPRGQIVRDPCEFGVSAEHRCSQAPLRRVVNSRSDEGVLLAPTFASICSTELGGVFYLINVALALELYGDFTRPRHSSLPLPLWDFLALLGRALIGAPFMQDDGWNMLAALAGRTVNKPPGTWFEPPLEWRMPASWLTAFPTTADWCGGIDGGRMRLRHPAGFLVLDVPCDPNHPTAGFAVECRRFGAAPDRVQWRETPDDSYPQISRVDRWVNWLTPYLSARLGAALNEPDADVVRRLVFHHRAEVRTNSERVAIRFALATHPIALRMAGLDRDPGWVPAAGRTIVFQYD